MTPRREKNKDQRQAESGFLFIFAVFAFLLLMTTFSADTGRIGISGKAVASVPGNISFQGVLLLAAIGLCCLVAYHLKKFS